MRHLTSLFLSVFVLACGTSAVPDASSPPDAAILDAATLDAATLDAGRDASAPIDASGPTDAAGPADSGGPDASDPPPDAGMVDACLPPPCARPPEGCHYEGFTLCTCGTLVCPPSACDPPCNLDEYCNLCEGGGACQPRPADAGSICPGVYNPVCGCDGRTYSNTCTLASAGIGMHHAGECGEGPIEL